jgi:hypothetical protein
LKASFLVNLRSQTMVTDFDRTLRPRGYLAAPAYGTTATRRFAAARPRTRAVVTDNGRFDDVGRVAAALAPEAQALLDALKVATPQGVSVDELSRRDIGTATRGLVDDFLGKLGDRVSRAPPPASFPDQLSYHPDGIVGEEDIWLACLHRLGVSAALLPAARSSLRARNEKVAANAAAILASRLPGRKPGCFATPARRGRGRDVWYLPVASALDYDGAFDAGRAFAAAGARAAALGFGALMADDSYIASYRRGGRLQQLPSRQPARYLRTALVARGLWDGWARGSGGQAPLRFHFLGLGAPIMLGLAALAGHATTEITFDATSPIQDAAQGTLYLADPASLKTRTRSLAARLADEQRFTWPCRCPFCVTYLTTRPFDLDAARIWRRANPRRPVTAADLSAGAPLARALPLLSEPNGGLERRAVDLARIGHNHWVMQRILARVNNHASSRDMLAAHQRKVVTAYRETTNSSRFADAVETAYQIITGSHIGR